MFAVRFGEGFECPKCRRSGGRHRIMAERAYSCQWCGHHLHPTGGTPFEKTRTLLQLWFYAINLFNTTRHGVSAKELQRQLGVTHKTAWRMARWNMPTSTIASPKRSRSTASRNSGGT
ncbi:transposase [Erythrobacter aureus]|uniref:transposase n=1 Tax=Erythrobacter aureus TaxID=2182384 RepID=UPI003F4E3BD1